MVRRRPEAWQMDLNKESGGPTTGTTSIISGVRYCLADHHPYLVSLSRKPADAVPVTPAERDVIAGGHPTEVGRGLGDDLFSEQGGL